MIKILGFITVLAATAKIGFDISEKYVNRTKQIKTVTTALEFIKNEIAFSKSVICDALLCASSVRSAEISKFFKDIYNEILKNSTSIFEAYKLGAYKNRDILALNQRDYEILEKLFSTIGSGDTENEIKNIDNAISMLDMNMRVAIDDEKRYVKLFRTSGILAGLLIAIVFI